MVRVCRGKPVSPLTVMCVPLTVVTCTCTSVFFFGKSRKSSACYVRMRRKKKKKKKKKTAPLPVPPVTRYGMYECALPRKTDVATTTHYHCKKRSSKGCRFQVYCNIVMAHVSIHYPSSEQVSICCTSSKFMTRQCKPIITLLSHRNRCKSN